MLCSRYRSSEEEVRAVQSPDYTDSWHPISHGEYLDMVLGVLEKKGLSVWKSEFALVQTEQMFGILDLHLPEELYEKDMTLSIGLRNSINKSLAAAAAIGERVFVCDNLSFSGQITFSKKHTHKIEEELPLMLEEAIDTFTKDFIQDKRYFEHWKQTEISVPQATDFLVRMAENKALLTPAILEVRRAFVTPPYPEFKEKNVWSLFNALTYFTRNIRRDASPLDVAVESQHQVQMFKQEWAIPQTAA
jgi:hypothetical protein